MAGFGLVPRDVDPREGYRRNPAVDLVGRKRGTIMGDETDDRHHDHELDERVGYAILRETAGLPGAAQMLSCDQKPRASSAGPGAESMMAHPAGKEAVRERQTMGDYGTQSHGSLLLRIPAVIGDTRGGRPRLGLNSRCRANLHGGTTPRSAPHHDGRVTCRTCPRDDADRPDRATTARFRPAG